MGGFADFIKAAAPPVTKHYRWIDDEIAVRNKDALGWTITAGGTFNLSGGTVEYRDERAYYWPGTPPVTPSHPYLDLVLFTREGHHRSLDEQAEYVAQELKALARRVEREGMSDEHRAAYKYLHENAMRISKSKHLHAERAARGLDQ